MLPFPSMGSPRAFTTLPRRSSPAGTSATFPVLFTIPPSFIPLDSPKITAPILSSSRFSTIPITPFSNFSNSPDIALLNPYILAIPSPISNIVPVFAISSDLLYPSISSRIILLTSSGLILKKKHLLF